MNKHYYVAIMAGGIGSRFWPKSRVSYPKQFLDILNTGETLIQQTFKRFASYIPEENIFIVTSKEYVDIVQQQLPKAKAENILSEPSRKNTAPCVAYVSFKIEQLDPEACLIIAPSDHIITDPETFKDISLKAIDFARHTKSIITLGIKPHYPNTGYGYIQHDSLPVAEGIYKVKTFTEKPNLELAKTFLESGDFLWNAGLFVWKNSTILKAFQQHQPEMYELFDTEKEHLNTTEEHAAIDRIYSQCTNISIDYAILEKADNVYVIPSSFGWSDLGTWNSAYENMEKDYLGNAVAGEDVIVIDAKECMISSQKNKLVLVQGIEDCIVVDSKDVLLICKKDKEQEIKDYVAEVKRNKGDKFL